MQRIKKLEDGSAKGTPVQKKYDAYIQSKIRKPPLLSSSKNLNNKVLTEFVQQGDPMPRQDGFLKGRLSKILSMNPGADGKTAISELKNEKDNEIAELRSENETLKSRMETLTSEMAVLKARLANSTTQEDRIAKLEELVSKIGQGE